MDSNQGLSSVGLRKRTLKPLELRRTVERECAKTANGETTAEEEPLTPAARLFQLPSINLCIIVAMGLKTEINIGEGIKWLEQTLFKHPRFTSKVVVDDKKGGEKRWVQTAIDLDYHIITPDLDPNMNSGDQFVEDYMLDITKTPMDLSRPPWELHVLNVKTSDANSVVVFRIHHSAGDGASLMSFLLACTRQLSNPEALPTLPTMKKRMASSGSWGNWSFFFAIWWIFRLMWNTFVDVVLFVATILFLKDSQTPIKGPPGVGRTPRRFVHLTLSLDDIKLVKNAMNMTINDVLLGITQAGLSRYLNRRYCEDAKDGGATEKTDNLPKNIRLRSTVVFNLRPSAGIQDLADMMEKGSKVKWGNAVGYVLLPFNISLPNNPLDYIHQAKAIIDRKKSSLEAICTLGLALKTLGAKITAALSLRAVSNTTCLFSNLVGPKEEVSFLGHPVAYIAPSIYGLPHALTIHFQSYVNKMTICVAVDEGVVPDPHRLCDDFGESLKLIKNAAIERGLVKNGAY
ncbi:hypothetical protein L1049_001652 [Liquidambar formosana]|uniref:Diacylglycerol O-acyltransferase n=2 Tax=Liquidambar formosana TaxID=63359 RepID=A0AAP0N6C3_LIQFO